MVLSGLVRSNIVFSTAMAIADERIPVTPDSKANVFSRGEVGPNAHHEMRRPTPTMKSWSTNDASSTLASFIVIDPSTRPPAMAGLLHFRP